MAGGRGCRRGHRAWHGEIGRRDSLGQLRPPAVEGACARRPEAVAGVHGDRDEELRRWHRVAGGGVG